MTDQLLSPHWYRVANVKISLAKHARVHQHKYRDTVWFILRDDTSGKHHRFNQAAYNFIRLIDGSHTIDEIWNVLQEDLGDDAPTQNDVISLLGTLHYSNLLQGKTSADIQGLIDRRKTERKQSLKSRLGNPMALRFPLLDPDAFLHRYMPYVTPFFTRTAALITIMIFIYAGLQMVRNWELLSDHALENTLSTYNLFLMWLVYPVIKALHELGHGFAVKRWGGEVHVFGIMLLVLMPVPYVDASAASSFPSKYRRMFVGAAGIIVEMLLASIALLLWLNIKDGLLSDILFNVMLIGGASTLLFNGNPLLKFDGYFVLADALEIPGLGPRANKYYGYLLQKYIFSVKSLESPVNAFGEPFWFLLYAPAALIYRLFLMVVITVFVAQQYFFIGVLLAIWALFMQAVMPVVKWLKFLFGSPVIMQQRGRVLSITAFAVSVLAAIVFFVPVPLHTVTEGVVWTPEKSHVRASADGFVNSVLVEHGEQVSSGVPLIATTDPLLDAQLRLVEAQYRELEIKHSSMLTKDIVQADIIQEELSLTQGRLEHLQQKITELVMKSPVAGEFNMINSAELEGHFVKQGEPVGYVINYDDVSIRVVVPQNAIGLVRQNVEHVEMRLVDQMDKTYYSDVSREIPAATYKLPSKALAQEGGGSIVTDPFDDEGTKTREQYFQFEVAMPEDLKVSFVGQRVYVKILHGSEPFSVQWYRAFKELFLDELGKV
jgi:putative peptide zinc metalloprotease protein